MTVLTNIILNGFVRRTLNTDVLKAGIKSTGAKLARKGRSRNWLLQADNHQILKISTFIYQSDEPSWLWVAKKINTEKPQLSLQELRAIVKQNPAITVNQIVALSHCSLTDARIVLDEFESL